MRIFKPLKHRRIGYLWGGQVFSSIGDELHEVAMVWLAADLIGTNTGLIIAVQAGAILTFSLFGGIWADRWDHRKTMLIADLLRGFCVLLLPLSSVFGVVPLWLLIFVAIVVASLRAFFDPALRATLPYLAQESELRHQTNALMETTSRFARILGPGILGILNQAVPMIHYFTVDAISYFISAFSISKLKQHIPKVELPPQGTIRDSIVGGFRMSKSQPAIRFAILSGAFTSAAWYFVFPLAVGLLLHQKSANVSDLSLLVAAYGVGNLAANLVIGGIRIENYARCLFMGRVVVGIGFVFMALAPTLPWMMAAAAFSAIGGPMEDVSKLTLVQRSFQPFESAKIFRFSMTSVYSALLVAMSISPVLFQIASPATLILWAGLGMAALGLAGVIRFRSSQ